MTGSQVTLVYPGDPRALVVAFLAQLDAFDPVDQVVAYSALLGRGIPAARKRAVGELVARGWTQSRIATATGVSRSAISHLVPKK